MGQHDDETAVPEQHEPDHDALGAVRDTGEVREPSPDAVRRADELPEVDDLRGDGGAGGAR